MYRRTHSGKSPDQTDRSLSSNRGSRGKNRAHSAPVKQNRSRKASAEHLSRGTSHGKNTTSSKDNSSRPAAASRPRPKTVSIAKHRRRRLKWHRLFLLLCLAVGMGYGAYWLALFGVPKLALQVRDDARLISSDSTTLPYSKGAYTALSNEIAAYLRAQPATYSVAGVDLKTGAEFSYHAQTEFSAAQTESLPIAMTLYSDIAAGLVKPDAIVRLTAGDEEAGPGYIGGMPVGTAFTVTQLARAAIDQGDVVAQNMLIRYLGRDQIDSFITGMGSGSSLALPYLVSPQDLSMSLSYLYTMDLAHSKAVAPLMQDLMDAPHEGRISKGFPVNTRIAHIDGDWPKEFHDAAIIWSVGNPVTLAICSDGASVTQASAVEAHVAALVAAFEQSGYVPSK
ncbi:MAG: class A beta-lactamase-related serine hydrolase [Firmicutes bacterium]|nr:class A beta-lactamase-related serine hydrolase [Bacillota bacterium]